MNARAKNLNNLCICVSDDTKMRSLLCKSVDARFVFFTRGINCILASVWSYSRGCECLNYSCTAQIMWSLKILTSLPFINFVVFSIEKWTIHFSEYINIRSSMENLRIFTYWCGISNLVCKSWWRIGKKPNKMQSPHGL